MPISTRSTSPLPRWLPNPLPVSGTNIRGEWNNNVNRGVRGEWYPKNSPAAHEEVTNPGYHGTDWGNNNNLPSSTNTAQPRRYTDRTRWPIPAPGAPRSLSQDAGSFFIKDRQEATIRDYKLGKLENDLVGLLRRSDISCSMADVQERMMNAYNRTQSVPGGDEDLGNWGNPVEDWGKTHNDGDEHLDSWGNPVEDWTNPNNDNNEADCWGKTNDDDTEAHDDGNRNNVEEETVASSDDGCGGEEETVAGADNGNGEEEKAANMKQSKKSAVAGAGVMGVVKVTVAWGEGSGQIEVVINPGKM